MQIEWFPTCCVFPNSLNMIMSCSPLRAGDLTGIPRMLMPGVEILFGICLGITKLLSEFGQHVIPFRTMLKYRYYMIVPESQNSYLACTWNVQNSYYTCPN